MSGEIDRGEAGKWLPGASANPDTRFPKGKSGNPGGIPKTRRELRALAREHMPRAIERAAEILGNDTAKPKEWCEAGKFLAGVCGLNVAPKSERDDEGAAARNALDSLTLDELRALARREMRMELKRDGDAAADAEH